MLQIKRILYPTDFSACAKDVLTHAMFFAEQYEAALHILHVETLHGENPHPEEVHLEAPDELLKRAHEIAESNMAALVEPHQEKTLEIIQSRRRGVFAGPIILDYEKENDIDLIVMGTHGRRGFRRAFLGSVTEEVVRQSNCPVLALRYEETARQLEPFRNILVPIDFSNHSQTALNYAIALGKIYNAKLHLLHVVDDIMYPPFYGPVAGALAVENQDELRKISIKTMEEWMAETPHQGVDFEVHVLTGRATARIADFSKSFSEPLMVLATHGLTGLERMVFGSTTEQAIRYVSCPLLAIKSFGKSLLPA